MIRTMLAAAACALTSAAPAAADIVDQSPDGFALHWEAPVMQSPEALWNRIITPSAWWSSDHTYSGDAANLTLDAKAGGCWCETWDGGQVEHGRVLSIQPGKRIVIAAPFGPLQSMAVTAVMTISISETDNGETLLTKDFIATGASFQNLEDLAPVVHMVQGEGFKSLASNG